MGLINILLFLWQLDSCSDRGRHHARSELCLDAVNRCSARLKLLFFCYMTLISLSASSCTIRRVCHDNVEECRHTWHTFQPLPLYCTLIMSVWKGTARAHCPLWQVHGSFFFLLTEDTRNTFVNSYSVIYANLSFK